MEATAPRPRTAQDHLESLIRQLEAESFYALRQLEETGAAASSPYTSYGPTGSETWEIPTQAFRDQVDRAACCLPLLRAELAWLNQDAPAEQPPRRPALALVQ